MFRIDTGGPGGVRLDVHEAVALVVLHVPALVLVSERRLDFR